MVTKAESDTVRIVADRVASAGHLVDGELIRPDRTFDVSAPWTGELLAPCPDWHPALVERAMAAARAALGPWSADLNSRKQALRELALRLDHNAEDIGRVNSAETGKPAPIGQGEVRIAADHVRWYSERSLPVDTLTDTNDSLVQLVREPVGVVAGIVPWNAPIVMLLNKIAASLLVGNTIVAKPSPYTPLGALLVAELVQDLVPPGVVNILAGGDDLGVALTTHEETNLVAFTGSAEAGKAIMAAGAPTLKRMLLELGGNDAAIVCPDVDVAAVAPKLYRAAFGLSGQICAAIKRLYVHQSIFDDIVAALTDLAQQARPGDPFDPDTTMGPLTTQAQYERVNTLIADALANGGTAVTGGAPLDRRGYFLPPTIITGVGAGTRLVDEEQFGPALPVLPYTDLNTAIEASNATPFGLGASIWTSDIEQGIEIARRFESGGAWVNRHPHVGADIPFGGAKASGLGREGGAVGVDAFCELKTISVDRVKGFRP